MRFRACFLKYNILFCILQQKTVRISLIFCVFHIYEPPSALCVPDFPVFFITPLTAEISKTGINITTHNTAVTKIPVALFKSATQSSRPLFTARNRIATYPASHPAVTANNTHKISEVRFNDHFVSVSNAGEPSSPFGVHQSQHPAVFFSRRVRQIALE